MTPGGVGFNHALVSDAGLRARVGRPAGNARFATADIQPCDDRREPVARKSINSNRSAARRRRC